MSGAAENESQGKLPTVGIVGGGLAGLAAACALAEGGWDVTLFERKPFLGGRASSYEHPGTGEVVDNCQHVLLGCCTNLRDFYRRLGVEDKIRWYERITFIEPGGRTGCIEPSRLPAPLHSTISFLRFKLLSLTDKLAIARVLLGLVSGVPEDSGEDFLAWLRRKGQSQKAIDHFWAPVLISSLNEELDKTSVKYACMVFRDAFLKSAEAGRMGVPTVPLSELYGVAERYITARGGRVLLRSVVEQVSSGLGGVTVRTGDGEFRFDYGISAIPFHQLGRILPQSAASDELQRKVSHLRTVPITGIHLWFDREITPLEHASLLDRNIQWMFQKSKILESKILESHTAAESAGRAGSYMELVVSSSKNLLEMGRAEIIELALTELAEFFPAVRQARLVKATVIKEVHATFAPAPLSEQYRVLPASAWPRLFMSGDWTATGWPSTMEGAVRSGYLTAEAVCREAGDARQFVVPDLKAEGLMRRFRP
ncbi:MAG: hydroxysqualene dehydroxylase HpnE [Candidatus Korobacteraceae bacterium]